MNEGFQPISNTAPVGLVGKIKFFGRRFLDFQSRTVFSDLRKILPTLKGNILDVGCGDSPYRFLLNKDEVTYKGVDIEGANYFNYSNADVITFNGTDIPFDDETFDGVICTEVLEHVLDYQRLVNEIHRVLKKEGVAIITTPWSARYHYIPYDYFRYTPSALKEIFSSFESVEICPRGNDVAAIAAKLVVLYARNIININPMKLVTLSFILPLTPFALLFVLYAHLSISIKFMDGEDDPLGYTVKVKK